MIKALEKEERRYSSAADLADDIRRFLRDEPIAARPPSARVSRSGNARRHTAIVAGVLACLVVLVAGVAATAVAGGPRDAGGADRGGARERGRARARQGRGRDELSHADARVGGSVAGAGTGYRCATRWMPPPRRSTRARWRSSRRSKSRCATRSARPTAASACSTPPSASCARRSTSDPDRRGADRARRLARAPRQRPLRRRQVRRCGAGRGGSAAAAPRNAGTSACGRGFQPRRPRRGHHGDRRCDTRRAADARVARDPAQGAPAGRPASRRRPQQPRVSRLAEGQSSGSRGHVPRGAGHRPQGVRQPAPRS